MAVEIGPDVELPRIIFTHVRKESIGGVGGPQVITVGCQLTNQSEETFEALKRLVDTQAIVVIGDVPKDTT